MWQINLINQSIYPFKFSVLCLEYIDFTFKTKVDKIDLI